MTWFVRALILAGLAACASTPPEREKVAAGGKYALVFEGATLPRRDLEKVVALDLADFVSSGFKKWAVDDAAYSLESYYLSQGYVDARVDYALDQDARGRPLVRLIVTEGQAQVVRETSFAGAEKITVDDLRATLAMRGKPFIESELSSGVGRIEELYRSRGYVDARAQVESVEVDEAGGVRIAISIQEGELVSYGEVLVTWEGEPLFPVVQEELAKASGRPYLPGSNWELRSRISELLGERGHGANTIGTQETRRPDSPVVDLVLHVDPGPEIRIAEIEVRNSGKTRESFVLSRLQFTVGELYTPARERASFRELFRTGLFSGVDIQPEALGSGDYRIVIELEERSSREVFIEPGYGSYERLRLRLGLRERNLWGDGINWRAITSIAELAQSAEVGISRSGIFGLDPSFEGGLTLFGERREEQFFTSEEIGARATMSWRHTETSSFRAEYQFLATSTTDADIVEADLDISSVIVGHTLDDRDHVFLPSSGSRTQVSLEVADESLGSDINFVRAQVNTSAFVTMGEDDVFAVSWRAGAIYPSAGGPDLPIQELFFNGGENSVRSFYEDKLGAEGGAEATGGEGYHVLSAEWRHAIGERTGLALFVDAGNVVPRGEDIFAFDGVEWGIGLGLRYLLPIGPVRVDAAWNPNADPDQDDVVVHFSVGMPF